MAHTANQLSEIDAQMIDWLQRSMKTSMEQRDTLKYRLEVKEISQVTFDQVDPLIEASLKESEMVISIIQGLPK